MNNMAKIIRKCKCNLQTNLLNRILSNVILFSCITCTLFIIYTCIRKFIEAPTTLSVKLVKISEVEFPEFTICPDLGSGYKTGTIKQAVEYRQNGMENMTWKMFDNFTLSLNEIIESIHFRYGNGYKSNGILSNSSEYAKISRVTIESRYGKCATVQIPKRYFEKDIQAIQFYSPVKNLSIFTHYPGQYYITPNPKVVAKVNSPLFVDFRFNLLHEIPGENCDPRLNGK